MLEESETNSASRREFLIWLQKKAIESANSFCKVVMTLSGGALAFSVSAFFKNPEALATFVLKDSLACAWLSWSLSCCLIGASQLFGHFGYKKSAQLVEEGETDLRSFAGMLSTGTGVLGGVAFLAGVVAMTIFAIANLEVM